MNQLQKNLTKNRVTKTVIFEQFSLRENFLCQHHKFCIYF